MVDFTNLALAARTVEPSNSGNAFSVNITPDEKFATKETDLIPTLVPIHCFSSTSGPTKGNDEY